MQSQTDNAALVRKIVSHTCLSSYFKCASTHISFCLGRCAVVSDIKCSQIMDSQVDLCLTTFLLSRLGQTV